ncbi:hypothetical protein CLV59_104409 [Chitinophaga dinghuensis]|uniref:Uncharacterized protein n=1 Tax=Chitinophaga dinghuensis TaxID=1539050 RepID=A0A327W2C0_9BACT|nr:hypothetical protein CLV59_104409 [Chitinophaga dinghuensis]
MCRVAKLLAGLASGPYYKLNIYRYMIAIIFKYM